MLFDNKIGVGDFVFYFAAIAGFSGWLGNIGDDINGIIKKGLMIGYYREYFDMPDKYNHGKGCELPKNYPLDIEFRNVSYKYPAAEDYTLKNLSFKIAKGEKLAIVGANGAGKTTLVKLICGLYFPTEGEILINGVSATEFNIEDYYTMFSVVFQDIYLLPLQIRQFIASHYEDVDDAKVTDSLIRAGLGDKINSLPNGIESRLMKGIYDDSIDLSGGERQKLMLARALYKDAPFVILDEPTAALDPIAENEIYLKYDEMTKDKTSVYISHRLASTRFCERIFFVENGDIAEIGSHDELIKSDGKYAYMYDIQSHYYKNNLEEVQENA
jgi:ABC-type multidrug transport system fused ATPase/permease subunit